MSGPNNGIAVEANGMSLSEWMHDESEHPYKLTPTRNNRKTVQFPAIIKCNTYILRHYGASIVEDIEQRMYDGDLALFFDVSDFVQDCMALRDCRISPSMSFWWQNRFEFLADLEVYMEADICTDSVNERRSCTVYVTLAFDFEHHISYTFDGFHVEKPDREDIRLDDYLIPIMSYDEVENAAEQLWYTYLPEAMRDRRCINAFLLAKAMGLRIESHRLYRMPKTKSILYWTESVVQVTASSDDDAPPVDVVIPGDTIVTNECLIPLDSRDLHILHECFHAEYHWLFYRLQEMHNNDLKTIRKKRKPKNQGKEPKNPLPILEWEARHGSRAMAMPRSIIYPLFLQYSAEEQHNLHHIGWALDNAGRRIADEWGVPKYLVRSRMLHLGFWQAQGSLNYVQDTKDKGRYIRPFMFDRESCPGTAHTFVISPLAASRLYENNEEYRARIDTGAYVYVEGHICLNDPKYVIQGKYGPRMTEWGNRHIDECCLRFENVYVVDENYEFHLNSINSDEEYNQHYNDYISRGETLTPKERSQRQTELIESLPHVPGQALRKVMDINGNMTNEELAEKALVSLSTAKRWLKEEYSYTPEEALRIIVATSMPPWLSSWFIEMAKVPLTYRGIHMMYREIIHCRFMDTMHMVNDWIEDAGYDRLKETA